MKSASKPCPEGAFLFSIIAPAERFSEPRFGWLDAVVMLALILSLGTFGRMFLGQ